MNPSCQGRLCPIRNHCERYSLTWGTDGKSFLAWSPWNHEKETCEFFIGDKQVLVEYKLKKPDVPNSTDNSVQ